MSNARISGSGYGMAGDGGVQRDVLDMPAFGPTGGMAMNTGAQNQVRESHCTLYIDGS
jgi:hypothetical protein